MLEHITAAEAHDAQRRAAGALQARGLRAGDRVALLAGPSSAYLHATYGALRVGIIPVLVNPALAAPERADLLADARPHAVLGDDELPGLLEGPPVDISEVPLGRPMLYTSGTTGRPKGVWSGVLDSDAGAALVAEERELWGFAPDDVHVVVSALYHSAPMRFAGGTLLAGGDVVLLNGFSVERWVEAIETHRPTSAFCAPAHLQRLFAAGSEPVLSSFRLLAHAGAPCPAPLKRRAMEAFPAGSVWEFYGSTEGQFTACSPDEWSQRPGTVGRARPHRRLEVDDDSVIWCEVPSYARFEYWDSPERTAAAWRGDSFSVGDLGRIDDDGYLFLDGRRDDLIISGGVNVYPLEVERTLLDHPGVADAAVFAVPDGRWGEKVVAAIVSELADAEVHDWLAVRLAPYKRPKDLLRVDVIPTTATGKVRRSRLATELGLADADGGH